MLTVEADNSWIDFDKIPLKLIPGIIVTADQDIGYIKAKELRKHDVIAADWESRAIVHICKLNITPFSIIRDVSDVPKSDRVEDIFAQGKKFRENTPKIMKILLRDVLPSLLKMIN